MPGVREGEFDEGLGPDEDYGPDDDAPPYWFAGNRMPADARRMGLTHHVPDGAILDFAGKLDPSRLQHRIAAWVMLVVFVLPTLFYILRLALDVLGR
ncbi:MAG: hypothetical protein WB797_17250 [Nocardioides sp.]